MKGKRGPVSIGLPEFRAILLSSLSKLGKSDTQKTALDEIKALLTNHANSEEKILVFLNSLTDTNEHLNNMHKREFIKMYGTLAEVLEGEAVPYIPRIVAALQKKMKEGDQLLHEALGFAFGNLVHNTLHTITDLPSSCEQLMFILKPLFSNLSGANKVMQVGSALAFTKIIQHAPIECLQYLLGKIVAKILEISSLPTCKCHPQLLESIISLTLSVESDIASYVPQLLPLGLQSMNSDDPNSRKGAIDLFYTFGAVVRDAVEPYAGEIVQLLGRCRTDKMKPVRDAAIETLGVYKDMRGEQVEPVHDHNTPRTAPVETHSSDPKPSSSDRRPTETRQGPRPDSAKRIGKKTIDPEENASKQMKAKGSIFKGPINPNFFRAASADPATFLPEAVDGGQESPQNLSSEAQIDVLNQKETAKFPGELFPDVQNPQAKATQRKMPPLVEEPTVRELEEQKEAKTTEFAPQTTEGKTAWQHTWNPTQETQGLEEPATAPKTQMRDFDRIQGLEDQLTELREVLDQMQRSSRAELNQMHERMNALEEMISTMSQLFEAKLKHAIASARSSV